MTERMATWDASDRAACGVPTLELTELYRRWGEGEPGIIATSNIMVDPLHLEARGNMIVGADAPILADCGSNGDSDVDLDATRSEGFQDIALAAKAKGSLIVGRISHPGRQCSKDLEEDAVSASDVQVSSNNELRVQFVKPHAATNEEIKRIVGALFTRGRLS